MRICTQSEWKLFALGVQLRIQLNLLQIAERLAFDVQKDPRLLLTATLMLLFPFSRGRGRL